MSFLVVVGLYVIGTLGASYLVSRRETAGDFLIAERRLGAVPLAISLSTSWLGGGSLAFMLTLVLDDLPAYLFLASGCLANLLLYPLFIRRPYELARANGWTTMTELVNGVLGPKSGRYVMVFVPVLFSSWLLFELVGSGLILSRITALTYPQSVVLITGVVCAYLLLGGFKSLIRTDIIQFGFMLFMLIACLSLAREAPAIDLSVYLEGKPGMSVNGFLAGFFGFFALQFTESTVWQRIFAARSAGAAQRALLGTSVLYTLSYGTLVALILLGAALHPGVKDETLFAAIAHEDLPPWLGALFMVSILAIIMSTVDTVLFIAAQCFSTDLAHVLRWEVKNPRRAIRTATFIMTLAVLALSLITQDIKAIFWFFVAMWAALVPIYYMFLPVERPSDESIFGALIILSGTVAILYLQGLYKEHYVAYVFFAGLLLPKVLDVFLRRRVQAQA